MTKINLLPAKTSETKETKQPAFNIQILPLFLFSLSLIFFLGGAYLKLETMYRKKSLSRVISQYQQAESLAKKINVVKQEQNRLTQELKLLNGYLKRDILWSEKLTQLRNLIPEEVWLTELSFKKQPVKDAGSGNLYLKGGLMLQEKTSSIGTLTNFINRLKEDQEFFADFDNLILADSQTETRQTEIRKNIEIMTFIIEMPFKKGKAN